MPDLQIFFSLYEPAFCVAILPVSWRLILSKLEFISYFNMSGKDLDDMTFEKFKFWKVRGSSNKF